MSGDRCLLVKACAIATTFFIYEQSFSGTIGEVYKSLELRAMLKPPTFLDVFLVADALLAAKDCHTLYYSKILDSKPHYYLTRLAHN